MTSHFASRIRESLKNGAVAVYEFHGRQMHLYRRDGKWYRLRVGDSPYISTETRIGDRALCSAVEEQYPIKTVKRQELPPAIIAKIESGTDEAVVATWLIDARRLANNLRAGEADRNEAKQMIVDGHQLEERGSEKGAERIREQVEKIAEALHES